jgi:outer membrane autotransporter protein
VGGTDSAALPLGALALHPHLTATVDKLFSGNGGNFDSVFTDEPGVELTTTYPNVTKTWGQISGGVAAALTDRISLGADFATTIAKSDGADHEVSGNLKVVF